MSKAKKIAKIVLVTILLFGVAGYLIFYMLNESAADPESKCIGMELVMVNGEETPFINKKDVEDILNKNHLTPTGLMMKDINGKTLETFISRNPFVKEVHCFKSSTGKIIVKITQRTPVIYILPEGKKGYFIDETGSVVPNVRYVSNIIVATGIIDEKYAKNELLPFALFIQSKEFWNNQIEQIHISLNKKRQRVVELVPRVGDHIIYLGKINDYEKKLHRLKVFYDKATGTIGWGKYEKINLEFENQLICTKHKQ